MDPAYTLDRYSSMVESQLRFVVSDRNLPLYDMMEHHLGWTSDGAPDSPALVRSRVLGALCLAACACLGEDARTALPAAASIELVQNFCEIHDDIQSGKIARNNRDAVWWKWGPAQAINAGDGMHALSRLALFGLGERMAENNRLPLPDAVLEFVKLLDQSSMVACEGRFMDLEAQERLDISSDSYVKIAEAKSGALFSCAMEFGALAAGADADARRRFADAGRGLGVAAQISEDMRQLASGLDEAASPSEDFMNKKKVYPVVRAFESASPSERRRLGDYYFKRVLEPSDVRALSAIVAGLGVEDDARAEIDARLEAACRLVGEAVAPTDSAAEIQALMRHVAGES